MYYIEWFVLRWIFCTALNCLYYVEWFVLPWIICTRLNYFFFLAKFVRPRMICTVLKDLYCAEWFGVRWMICTTLNHLGYDELLSIGLLMRARCTYSKKYCKIFYANLWVEIFTDLRISRRNIFGSAPELVIKTCFWSL